MKIEESKWIAREIINRSKKGDKLLNIGSSSLNFRTNIQPHIHKNIFDFVSKKGVKITHTDIQDVEGVDLVGDLLDEEFVKTLENEQFDIIVCSNLLEHL